MGLVNGVWQYTGTENAAPTPALLNLLGDSIRTLLANPTWAAVPVDSSWAVTSFQTPVIAKVGSEIHMLPGAITRALSAQAIAPGSPLAVATLGAAHRPAVALSAPCVYHAGSGTPCIGRIEAAPSGSVTFIPSTSGSIGTGGWPNVVYLPTMMWRAQ